MSINKFQLALALTRRLDRFDDSSRADAERIIDAVEAGRPHVGQLRAFFPDAWARCGRAAAAASTPKAQRVALAHLAVLAELETVLGLGPQVEQEHATEAASNSTESEHFPEPDPVSSPESETDGWSAAS